MQQQPYGYQHQLMQQQYMQQQYMQQQYGQQQGQQPGMTARDHEIEQMILREELQQENARQIKALKEEAAVELLNQQRLSQLKSLRSPPK
jgi:hypothetical protein